MRTNRNAMPARLSKTLVPSTLTVLAAMLSACGGGGVEDSGTAPTAPSAATGTALVQYTGTIVVPASLTATATAALAAPGTVITKSAACPLVPDGYEPAAGANVEFLGAAGQVLATGKTDSCGALPATTADAAASIRVQPVGFQAVSIGASRTATATIASALPTGAKLEIAALQVSSRNALTALVVDSVTKKAVLGLPASAFSATVAGANAAIAGVSEQSLGGATDPYSTVLVMDASGSMTTCAANCSGDVGYDRTQPSFSRLQMATRAAHRFFDGKKATDEVGLAVFDSTVTWVSDSIFVNKFRNAAGATVSYAFSADGFTTSSDLMRLPVDYYNDYSTFYRTNGDALHPVTAALGLKPISGNPWGGSTALFTATKLGIDKVAVRPLARKIVIAMTDGQNNAGRETLATAVAAAKAAGVPVYTIGFGLDPNSTSERTAITDLQQLASQTGADSSIVNGTDIVGLFAGLQTAIRFQTTITLGAPLTSGQQASLLIVTPGQPTISRTVTVPTTDAVTTVPTRQ